jgi:hypothetical protein
MPFFTVNVRYRVSPSETTTQQRERREKERAALKAAGFAEERFHWKRDAEPKTIAATRAKAEAYATKASEATGVILKVVEGDYL